MTLTPPAGPTAGADVRLAAETDASRRPSRVLEFAQATSSTLRRPRATTLRARRDPLTGMAVSIGSRPQGRRARRTARQRVGSARLLRPLEIERRRVDAVPLPGRAGAVVEDVAQVRAAVGAT